MFHSARCSGKSEAIRQAARMAEALGCNMVVTQLAGIQTAEDRANQNAIEVDFRIVPEVKELTDGVDKNLPDTSH